MKCKPVLCGARKEIPEQREKQNMKPRRWMSTILVCLSAALAISVQLSAQTITTFDAPGVGTSPAQGTNATGINAYGAITGMYTDSNYVWHGFLRAPNGTFTTFDAPGAGTGVYYGTFAFGLNLEGATAVKFNGITAAITYDTFTRITVTVPVGATTGKIKVVTPGGKAKTTTVFTVT